MAERTDPIRQSIEETRQDIVQTRSAMTEKLEMLEERVRETVESARSTVEDIVENVKETVDETVGTVKETVGDAKSTVEDIVGNVRGTMDDTVSRVKQSFDLRYQVEQRPWFMVGSSILVGYLLGSLGRRQPSTPYLSYARENESYVADTTGGTGPFSMPGEPGPGTQPPSYTQYPQSHRRRSWSSTLGLDQFREEIDLIKGALIGALMSNLREVLKQNMPSVAPQLEKAFNSATTKLGAQPVNTEQYQQATSGTTETNPPSSNRPTSAREQQTRFTTV